MKDALVDLLCCPFCGGSLTAETGAGAQYDILRCRCGQYPVVAGIPVLKKRVFRTGGGRIEELIGLIRAGSHREALAGVLLPPPPASVLQAPESVQALRHWTERAVSLLTSPVEKMTACEFIEFYFRRSRMQAWEAYSYFLFRFGMPRHLVSLALARLIDQPEKPILDLACGFGHITRSLLRRSAGELVIGMDEDFFGLYVAKNWVAPEAEYLCAAADLSLPFRDGAFAAGFCVDAFQSFTNKLAGIRELRRLVSVDGVIVLASLRNRLVEDAPYSWMSTLPPEGYTALVGEMPHRLVSDAEILAQYLQKQGPQLARPRETAEVAGAEWLSLVASHRQEIFRDHGTFDEWPHSDGHPTLNPLYREESRDELGSVQLRRVFPSTWYREENAVCGHRRYLPEIVSVKDATLTDLAQRRRSSELDELIGQCVVLGMPERYLPDRYWRVAENAGRAEKAVGGRFYIEEIGVSDLAAALIPPEDTFIVVDDWAWEGKAIAGRRALPFLERDGRYWGRPPDDASAIRELERLRQSGAKFIVFGSPAMWWLAHYSGFSRHLYARFRCVLQNEQLVIFDIRS